MGLIHDLVDFCYPGRCARCERSAGDSFLCVPCDAELIALATRPACERCAMPLGGLGSDCPYCEGEGNSPFERVAALGAFRDPLRHLVYAVKYRRKWGLAEQLTDRLLEQESVKGLMTVSDVLVPVPLHRFRHITRGFNQAEVIARRLAKRCGKRVEKPVVRLRNTESQIHLHSRAKREENLKDAFGLIDEWSVRNRHVVLIDDVTTTGSTLKAVAKALHPAEPASISAIVLAVADPQGQDFQYI